MITTQQQLSNNIILMIMNNHQGTKNIYNHKCTKLIKTHAFYIFNGHFNPSEVLNVDVILLNFQVKPCIKIPLTTRYNFE